MSRKDYETFAKIIADELQDLRHLPWEGAQTNGLHPHRRICMSLLLTVAYGMSETFQNDNARFDEDRFMGACGFNYLPPRTIHSLGARWGV